MNKFIIVLFTISIPLFFTSCLLSRPVSTSVPENNNTYTVDFLFEHDGCKVYRFHDQGRFVYFTNCNGETISSVTDSMDIINKIKVNR